MNYEKLNYFRVSINEAHKKHPKLLKAVSTKPNVFKFYYVAWSRCYCLFFVYAGDSFKYYIKDLSKNYTIHIANYKDSFDLVEDAFIHCAKLVQNDMIASGEQLEIKEQ